MADYALFLEPDETAFDLFARIVVEPFYLGIPFLDQAISLRPGQVIELSGPSGTAKSDILVQASSLCLPSSPCCHMCCSKQQRGHFEHWCFCILQAAATCILPKMQHGISYGGQAGTFLTVGLLYSNHCKTLASVAENVVFVDLDSKFDLLRLIQVGAS